MSMISRHTALQGNSARMKRAVNKPPNATSAMLYRYQAYGAHPAQTTVTHRNKKICGDRYIDLFLEKWIYGLISLHVRNGSSPASLD